MRVRERSSRREANEIKERESLLEGKGVIV